ncbi:MAG: hypothetical protein HGB35_03790 [Geobacteraceae bacterium]|nr:hypothetical protein [Geobacteraceae bacterium]
MKLLASCLMVLALTATLSSTAKAENADRGSLPGQSIRNIVVVPKDIQPWQIRRKEFAETIRGVQEGNVTAIRELDRILTECEKDPFLRTPPENMDILGVFYIPKDGVETVFEIVVMHAAMGWYDALRFGSGGARAELANTERFFLRPFLLGGERVTTEALKFFKSNPEHREMLLKKGIHLAEIFRNNSKYDHEWPASYGVHRAIVAMSGEPIKSTEKMPKEEWDKAWLEAKKVVTMFYTEECVKYLEIFNARNHPK